MRWIRRFALFSAGVWAFLALASVYSFYLSRSTPDWYVTAAGSDRQESAQANQTQQQAAALISYANDVAAWQRRRYLASQSGKLGKFGETIPTKTLELTQRQLNAFVDTWESALGTVAGDGEFRRHFRGTRFALVEGRVIIASTLVDVGLLSNTVASLEFSVRADEQNLWPRLERAYAGRLPVPKILLRVPQQRVIDALEDGLSRWQAEATIGPDGLGNGYLAEAVLAKTLLAALHDRKADSVILLPCQLGNLRRAVPLKVQDLRIYDDELSITLRPLTDGEMNRLLSIALN